MKCLNSRWQPSTQQQRQRSSRGLVSHGSRPQPAAGMPWRLLAQPPQVWRGGAASPPAAAAAETASTSSSLESDLSATLSLSLANIRQSLIRQEDTIIFSLIERAQFARNDAIYQPGAVPVPGYLPDGRQLSFLEYLLRETEQVHGKIRRYTSPDEAPYFPDALPPLVIPPISYPQVLAPSARSVNINAAIMDMYLEHLMPEMTQPGDDHNYGSAAMYDVMILQALSKRIHYGKFVAEAKFQGAPAKYGELIRQRDAAAILELLTDRAVELKVIERVQRKAATFGQDLDALPSSSSSSSSSGGGSNGGSAAAPGSYKIKPEAVAELYEKWVMPLTKEVEVQYLLRRLDDEA